MLFLTDCSSYASVQTSQLFQFLRLKGKKKSVHHFNPQPPISLPPSTLFLSPSSEHILSFFFWIFFFFFFISCLILVKEEALFPYFIDPGLSAHFGNSLFFIYIHILVGFWCVFLARYGWPWWFWFQMAWRSVEWECLNFNKEIRWCFGVGKFKKVSGLKINSRKFKILVDVSMSINFIPEILVSIVFEWVMAYGTQLQKTWQKWMLRWMWLATCLHSTNRKDQHFFSFFFWTNFSISGPVYQEQGHLNILPPLLH